MVPCLDNLLLMGTKVSRNNVISCFPLRWLSYERSFWRISSVDSPLGLPCCPRMAPDGRTDNTDCQLVLRRHNFEKGSVKVHVRCQGFNQRRNSEGKLGSFPTKTLRLMYTLQFDGPFRIITNLGSRVILPASYTEWLKNCPDLDHQALVHDVCCSCLCR